MKKEYIATKVVVLLFCLFFNSVNGQVLDILADPELNYYETVEKIESVINQMPDIRTGDQERDIKRYFRWN